MLALLLLRLSLGIVLLPALFVALVTALAARRRRPAPGLWFLSPARQEEMESLSPRAQRLLCRLLAIIGWAMAGLHNRGMRPRPRQATPGLRPTGGPRAPPYPG